MHSALTIEGLASLETPDDGVALAKIFRTGAIFSLFATSMWCNFKYH